MAPLPRGSARQYWRGPVTVPPRAAAACHAGMVVLLVAVVIATGFVAPYVALATRGDVDSAFMGFPVVEAIFAWPGVGRVLVEAEQARDYPVVLAAAAVSAALVVAGNLLAELLAGWFRGGH